MLMRRIQCWTHTFCVIRQDLSWTGVNTDDLLHSFHLLALSSQANDLTIRWQNLNPLSQPNATLAPQARQAKASGENLNYMTLAPQARQARPSGEILNYLLSR